MNGELAGITDLGQAANTGNRVTNRNELSREDFFEIMTLQLQQQDPMSPMESENFLNQLVSMQSLDTMEVLTDSLSGFVDNQSFTTASGLIGKVVVTSGANPIAGMVDQVVREGDDVTIKISLDPSQQTVSSLLGKEVLGIDDDGNFKTGTIADVTTVDGQTHLVVSDGLAGSDDILIPYNDQRVIKITSDARFDEITEIGQPVDLGDLDEQQ